MDTIFMNSENSKTPKPYILILKLTNKLDLKLVPTNFYQIFLLAPNDSSLKTMKNIFYFI